MHQIRIPHPGDHRVLHLVSAPSPGPDDVHIGVEAPGVNFADIIVRLGLYASAKKYVGWPITPGFEVAGTVLGVGEKVNMFKKGDRVLGVCRFGGYASEVVLPAAQVLPLPSAWTMAQGAGFPVAFLTAWYGLCHLGRARAGETALIHSAAGGVGQALVQLAVARGVRVIGTVGSAAKIDTVLGMGAAACVDRSAHRDQGWAELRRLAPGGYDLILDALGVDALRQGYAALAPCGRLVVYGAATMFDKGGDRVSWPTLAWRWLRTPRFNPLDMTTRNCSIHGFNLSFLFDRADVLVPAMHELLDQAARGHLQPLPVQTFPLAEVARAHAALESGSTQGKLVLLP